MEAAPKLGNEHRMDLVLDQYMPAVDHDHQLLHQIAAGNEDALRELYAAYGQQLYAYALRVTGDPAAAEEALQECLVAVWQGAGTYRGQGRVIAWLHGIVHHKALNQARGRVVDSLDEQVQEPPAHEPLPEAQAAAHEQQRLVQERLQGLPLEHRLALELVFYQGFSLQEVARVLDCPVGTVKSRLNYAKANLRGALSRAGLTAEDVQA